MKFVCETEINLPVKKVVDLFDNQDNRKYWQQGFVSYNHICGNSGEPGAKSKIVINLGDQVIELTETILVRNPPHELSALYEHKSMVNTMKNRFIPVSENKTKYEVEIHYTKFIGFIPKMLALLVPGAFKKQVQDTVNRFKMFAEGEK